MKPFKLQLLIFFFAIATIMVKAQSLPGKQTVAVWLPSNVKIDGKADEWNNSYQAYNHGAEVYYTIANDNDNLYVVIHAVKSGIIEKMIEGGIGFTIYSSGKKDDDKKITILYPLMSIQKCQGILLHAGKKLSAGPYSPTQKNMDIAYMDKTLSLAKANEELIENSQEIKVSGLSSIIDTISGFTDKTPHFRVMPLHLHHFEIISVKNNDGIKASSQFDNEGSYTYELALPIKLLTASLDKSSKFSYNITIHGRGEDNRPGNMIWANKEEGMLNKDLETATDFSGEYTLAKKP